MKIIAVYFAATDDASPPSGKVEYVDAYCSFAKTITQKGGRLVIVRGKESHRGGNRFENGWELEGDAWKSLGHSVDADLVFVKDRDIPVDPVMRRVNSPEFENLCSNKDETYAAFPEAFPETVCVGSDSELDVALERIAGDLIVAKPADGACGRNIFIGKSADLDRASLPYPLLLQEWIDMSQGIPGVCSGVHDLRIVIIAGKIALCTLRQPAGGSLIANAAQGGSIRLIPLKDIPEQALALALSIDRRLQQYPERVYSVDMGLHQRQAWKVIELNAPPGLTPPKWGSEVREYYDVLADHLLAMAS
jgi:hypothetical protein